MDKAITIEFPDQSAGEATRSAESLRQTLLDEASDEIKSIEVQRTDDTAMDAGTTLAIVLGTPAAIALARGLAGWIRRHGTIVVVKRNGEILMKNFEGKDAAAIAKEIAGTPDTGTE